MEAYGVKTYIVDDHILSFRNCLRAIYYDSNGALPEHIETKVEEILFELSGILEPTNDEYSDWDIKEYLFYETFIYENPEKKRLD